MLKLLYVYRWATFGGVERVLLSRAEAFKQHGLPFRIFLHFMEDSGAIEKIKNYIETRQLAEYIQLVPSIHGLEYDYIVSIDTPEILEYEFPREKLLFECHTTYLKNRKYLATVPAEVKLIAVPSAGMKADLERERPELQNRIVVVTNFVADDSAPREKPDKIWEKRPLLYLGRMDEHKNIFELLDVIADYRSRYGDDLMLVLVGKVEGTINLDQELRRRKLVDRTVVLPPVGFDRVDRIYSLIKAHEGVFMSSSTAEAFGLSVAEAMVNGLPVLLSGIRAHVDLVQGNMDFLYPLGDVFAGTEKLKHLVDNYDALSADIQKCKRQFSAEEFIADWNYFMGCLSSCCEEG